MERQIASTREELAQTWLNCYGGAQKLAEKLSNIDAAVATDAVGKQQVLRLLGHLALIEPENTSAFKATAQVTEVRPTVLECDVVRFQNNKEKWVALVGLLDGYPYEIFTGLQDEEEGILLPKSVSKGKIVKQVNNDGTKRYDFQFENTRDYKITVEGINEKFNPEYWNYAKLISGVLRYGMPIGHVIKLVASLSLNDESINTWKNGVERALKKYLPGQGDKTESPDAADITEQP